MINDCQRKIEENVPYTEYVPYMEYSEIEKTNNGINHTKINNT